MSDGMRDADRPFSSQKGADLTPTPTPLDLRAVEEKLRTLERLAPGFGVPFSEDTAALLAHGRASIKALKSVRSYLAVHGWNMTEIDAVLNGIVDEAE